MPPFEGWGIPSASDGIFNENRMAINRRSETPRASARPSDPIEKNKIHSARFPANFAADSSRGSPLDLSARGEESSSRSCRWNFSSPGSYIPKRAMRYDAAVIKSYPPRAAPCTTDSSARRRFLIEKISRGGTFSSTVRPAALSIPPTLSIKRSYPSNRTRPSSLPAKDIT